AARQRVAGALEGAVRREAADLVAVLGEPALEKRRLAGALRMAEDAWDEDPAPNKTGVGREHHVGQPRHRIDPLDARADLRGQRLVEGLPLPLRQGDVSALAAVHPGVDLVVDA